MDAYISKIESLIQLLESSNAWCQEHEFYAGVGFAFTVVLLIILFWVILFAIFTRRSKLSNVVTKTAYGSLTIQTSAIRDLVFSLAAEFPEITLSKCDILKSRNGISLRLQANANGTKISVPEASERLQSKIQESLKHVFGIENIEKIGIKIRSIQTEEESSQE